MIGIFTEKNEALLMVRMRGPSGLTQEIPFTIDTGFDDYLTMTPQVIQTLGLPARDEVRYQTADGTRVVSKYYAVEIEWLGVWKRIPVIEIEGGFLISVAMFAGCRLTIDVIEGGTVLVEKIAG